MAGDDKPAGLKEQLIEWGRTAVPAIVGTLGFAGWVSVLGAAVVWMRFSTAGIPADQAVHDLPLGEMLVTGAVSLIVYLVLGFVAVLVVYLLQGIVVSRVIGEQTSGNPAKRLQSEAALAKQRAEALEAEIGKLTEGGAPAPATPKGERLAGLETQLNTVSGEMDQAAAGVFKAESVGVATPQRGNQWGLMVVVAAELVLVLLRTDISGAGKLVIGLLAAAAGVTIVGAAAEGPTGADATRLDKVIRGGIAAAIAVFAIFLVASKPWTFAPVFVCILLAFANLAIGRLHPERFFWYGIAIFASVGLFGAVLTYSRDLNAPSAQPAAVLLKNGCAVRGLWVGEGSSRVFMARLGTPEQKPGETEPVETLGAGRVFWVKKEDVLTESVGKLQRLKFAVAKSGELRSELINAVKGGVLGEKHCESLAEQQQTKQQEKREKKEEAAEANAAKGAGKA